MELRYWLIVIGVIVIVGILFDGWRRMRGGSGKLKFKLDHSFSNLPDDDSDPDLLGPSRVIDRKREPEFNEADMPTVSASELNRKRNLEPKQGDLGLDADEPVPTLLTPVEDEDEPHSAKSSKEQLPVEEVLVINVIARDAEGFKGPALLQNILESGLRFGEMDIFHRHESMAGNGEVLFSMANGVKPGTRRPIETLQSLRVERRPVLPGIRCHAPPRSSRNTPCPASATPSPTPSLLTRRFRRGRACCAGC